MVTGLRVQLREETAKEFRKTAMEMFGYSKGSLSHAAEKAFGEWIERIEILKEKSHKSPTEKIRGLIRDIKIDSVELQHMASKIIAKKASG